MAFSADGAFPLGDFFSFRGGEADGVGWGGTEGRVHVIPRASCRARGRRLVAPFCAGEGNC